MEQLDDIRPGMTREHELTVEEEHAVSPAGRQVLSTPMMIRYMELNSAKLIHPLLPAHLASVGYEVHIRHKAPAPLGAKLTVWSKLVEIDGRKLLFDVRVTEGEKLIGEGTHRRTIVPIHP
jgi:fluoroacetyl-CoA thioesterase